jgi:hypothetical protein
MGDDGRGRTLLTARTVSGDSPDEFITISILAGGSECPPLRPMVPRPKLFSPDEAHLYIKTFSLRAVLWNPVEGQAGLESDVEARRER